ncbi:MAG: hypothetical protein GY784_04810 [Gammaproteobacteria bacterium]|nr:hypothetical protein [Gammaproteobacteria bacterium]
MELGKELILALPDNCSESAMESTMEVIITVWNSSAIDSWNKNNDFEMKLIQRWSMSLKK